MLELYTSEPNGFFLKPLVALAEKEASFTVHYFDAANFEQFAASFPANAESRLQLEREGPLLRHDGALICNSFFMLEYIAEALPGRALLPADPFEAYRARAWGQFLGAHLGSAVPLLGCAEYLVPKFASRDAAALDAAIAAIEPAERRAGWTALRDGSCTAAYLDGVRGRLQLPVGRIEHALQEAQWLAGADFSIADIDAYAMLCTLPDLAPAVVNAAATPRIVEYLARIARRDSVREALRNARTERPGQYFVPGIEAARWG
jgi:glutathione S-transferase